jgi:hypothetical protein
VDLDFAILADGVTPRQGKLDIQGAGWDTIYAADAPAVHARLVLALRLLISRTEAEHAHRLEVIIQGADGLEIGRAVGEMQPLPPEARAEIPAGRQAGVAMVMNFPAARLPRVRQLPNRYPVGRQRGATPAASHRREAARPVAVYAPVLRPGAGQAGPKADRARRGRTSSCGPERGPEPSRARGSDRMIYSRHVGNRVLLVIVERYDHEEVVTAYYAPPPRKRRKRNA